MRDDDAEQLQAVKGIQDERGVNPTSLRFVLLLQEPSRGHLLTYASST